MTTVPPARRDPMVLGWVAASTLSWFGDSVVTVALAWTAVRLLHPAAAGLVVGLDTVPQAVLMLFGGVLADRFSPRLLLLIGALAQAVLVVAVGLLWLGGVHTAAVLVVLAVGFGTAAGLTASAEPVLTRRIVAPDDLVVVAGWNHSGRRVAVLAGAPVGAGVVAAAGFGLPLLIDAGTFLVAVVVLVLVVRTRFLPPPTDHLGWRSELKDGFAYLRRRPEARWLVLGLTGLNVFITPVTGVGVALRVSHSGWGAGWVGAGQATLAVGAIAGGLAAARWRTGSVPARGFAVLIPQGLALAAVGLDARVALIGAMAMIGLTAGLASVWLGGTFQAVIEPSHLGRVSSLNRMGDFSLTPIAVPVFGALAAGAGLLVATAVCGVAMALLCAFFGSRPAIRAVRLGTRAQSPDGSERDPGVLPPRRTVTAPATRTVT